MLELVLQSIVSGLLVGGIYALVALGLNIIFGVMKIINFSHGSLMMAAMYLAFLAFQHFGLHPYISLFVIIPIMFLFGILIQKVFIQPIMNADHHNQLLLTLGLSIILESVALMLFAADDRFINTTITQISWRLGPVSILVPQFIASMISIIVGIAVYLFLKKTDTGKALRAASEERLGALLSGIPVKKINGIAFGIGVACVGIAGVMITPYLYVNPYVGANFNVMAFIIVVLGGMGNTLGSIFGGLVIGVMESLGGAFLPGSLRQLVPFVIFILILLFKPTGLMGRSK